MPSKLLQSMLYRLVGLDPANEGRAQRAVINVIDKVKAHPPEYWAKYTIALGITTEAGVLRRCKFHDGSYFQGNQGMEKAYNLGNAQFIAGEFKGTFESTREMTDMINKVITEHQGPSCSICASNSPWG